MKTGGGPCGDPLQRRGRPGPLPRSPFPGKAGEGPGEAGPGLPQSEARREAAAGGRGRSEPEQGQCGRPDPRAGRGPAGRGLAGTCAPLWRGLGLPSLSLPRAPGEEAGSLCGVEGASASGLSPPAAGAAGDLLRGVRLPALSPPRAVQTAGSREGPPAAPHQARGAWVPAPYPHQAQQCVASGGAPGWDEGLLEEHPTAQVPRRAQGPGRRGPGSAEVALGLEKACGGAGVRVGREAGLKPGGRRPSSWQGAAGLTPPAGPNCLRVCPRAGASPLTPARPAGRAQPALSAPARGRRAGPALRQPAPARPAALAAPAAPAA